MIAVIRTNRYEEVTKKVKDNGGFCPCAVNKDISTKCPCDEFVESDKTGVCRCGRFEKIRLIEVKDSEGEGVNIDGRK